MNVKEFSKKWINAWNAHNLDLILSHYTEDFEITTPMIKKVLGDASGTLKGKQVIKEYWQKAFEKFPDLHFYLLDAAEGVNSIVLWYQSVMNLLASEVMFYNQENKIYKVIVHYASAEQRIEYQWIKSVIKRFSYYKHLGENALKQIQNKDKLFWQYNPESNSLAIIVNHLHGNMLSRWTDFLTSDGEKPWRNRDREFENVIQDEETLWRKWNEGWNLVLQTLTQLTPEDLNKKVYIRGEAHSVIDAVHRQMTHYAYHIGQIVFLAKMIVAEKWQSLSIPKGKSKEFNEKMRKKFNK